MTSFKALLVEKQEDKSFTRSITERSLDDLPDGTLLIKVEYSSLNYKEYSTRGGTSANTFRLTNPSRSNSLNCCVSIFWVTPCSLLRN